MKYALEKAETLLQAIKYIKQFEDRIIVIKYGGNAMIHDELKKAVFEDIATLWCLGLKVVVVNGAGPKIDQEMRRKNLQKKMVGGLRVTDGQALKIVEEVLNEVNQDCVKYLSSHGAEAENCTEGTLQTRTINKKLGFVGDVEKVRTEKLLRSLEKGHIPVVSSIGNDQSGQATNINADTAASAIAVALNAEKLTILTNVDAVTDSDKCKISHLSLSRAKQHIEDGTINGGMIPKIRSCISAVKGGVKKAHLLNGTMPRALLLEIFTDEGIGTEVVAK